ncbi:hypothetical protein P43SY_009397 [Pythium insidiosum]|uniref:START domain-containing protein n=1 Tax=Pythium insidiosum TaxID=114742 RepID=A0AAD5LEX6_PYTIN|nr:hypothetical protein P43SY_009397 [Pythium insidiosum]
MGKRRIVTLSASQYVQQVRLPTDFPDHARVLVDNVLKEALYRHHSLHHDAQGRVDGAQWKLLKEKHRFSCYRSTSSSPSSTCPSDALLPDIMAVGIVPGALDDVLHGAVNLTPEAMKLADAMARGDLVDGRLLALLSPPTPDAPFRSLTLKWVIRDHAPLSKQRDYVYLEATGTTMSPSGERLGYLVAHSVKLAAVPEFHKDSQIQRGHVSYCFLFRQRHPQNVEVFFKGKISPRGGAKERAAASLAVDVITASATSVLFAEMKKLLFALRTTESESSNSGGSSSSSSSSSSYSLASLPSRASSLSRLRRGFSNSTMISDDGRHTTRTSSGGGRPSLIAMKRSPSLSATTRCEAERCARSLGALSRKARCQLCWRQLCRRCVVVKPVFADASDLTRLEKLAFCGECMEATTTSSARWMAAQELQQLDYMFVDEEELLLEAEASRRASNYGVVRSYDAYCKERTSRRTWECHTGSSSVDDRPSVSSLQDLLVRTSSGVPFESSFVVPDYFDELDDDDDDDGEMPIIESYTDDDEDGEGAAALSSMDDFHAADELCVSVPPDSLLAAAAAS